MPNKLEKNYGLEFRNLLIGTMLLIFYSVVSGLAITSCSKPSEKNNYPTITATLTPQIQKTNTPKPVTPTKPAFTPTITEQELTSGCPSSNLPGMVYELTDGILKGALSTEISGSGLQKINIDVQSLIDSSFFLQILPGTIFKTATSGVQTMVSIECREIEIDSGELVSLTIDVACASMHDETPGSNDSFTAYPPLIDRPPFDPEELEQRGDDYLKEISQEYSYYVLEMLTSSREFQRKEDFRTKQFAVWIVTNNPAPNEFVRLGSFGAGSGPSTEELLKIRELFREVFRDIELKVDDYRAFSELE